MNIQDTDTPQLGEPEEIFCNEENEQDPSRWLRLATYGDHPHPAGIQRLDETAANNMAENFNSLKNRLLRRFGGCPVYIGHPDDAGFSGKPGHTDTRAYGWVEELEVRDDGLWLRAKWSEAGKQLLANAHYRFFSPRWAVRQIGQRLFQPTSLVSLGLTNEPNIRGEAIANEVTEEPDFYRHACDLQEEMSRLRQANTHLQEALEKERTERISLLLANAEQAGRISPAERSRWATKLQDDFENATTALSNTAIKMKTVSECAHLAPDQRRERNRTAIEATHRRMEQTGEDFITAWGHIRRSA